MACQQLGSAPVSRLTHAVAFPSRTPRRVPAAQSTPALPVSAGHTMPHSQPQTNSNSRTSMDPTALAQQVLHNGNGLARCILSDPDIEGDPLSFLKQTEAYWKALKQQKHEPHKAGPTVVTTSHSSIGSLLTNAASTKGTSSRSGSSSSTKPPSFGAAPGPSSDGDGADVAAAANASASPDARLDSKGAVSSHDFDVIMCGGTLGICVALALQQQGFRVAVVERRRVEGRTQEWNSSRHEIQVLVDMGLLTQAELEEAIVSDFNPIHVGFKGGAEPLSITNVLNIGVSPKTLIATLRAKFEVLGGVVYEQTAFKSAVVASDGVVVSTMSSAAVPPDLGDTNRPNALTQPPQEQLHSPFGRVAFSDTSGYSTSASASASASASSATSSSSSNGTRNASSRYERWLNATSHGSSNGRSPPGINQTSTSTSTSSSANGSSCGGRYSGSNGNGVSSATAGRGDAAVGGMHGGAGRESAKRCPPKLTCRLLLDCMGHYSPIVKQMRGRAKPDGMVLVVGGCASGFAPERNTSADLLYSITDTTADMQLFWEAFPAEGGAARTTYMFCYSDADPSRPSFEQLLDTYFTLLPSYQGLSSLDSVKFKRVLFGGFPCYSSATPLAPGFDRVLQLGDASASQSPLSFGGFGSLLRHLNRLAGGISHALSADKLSRRDLSWIHPYQPSLSAAWLFQRSMSMKVGQQQQQQLQQQDAADNAGAQSVAASSNIKGANAGGRSSSSSTGTSSASSKKQPLPAWLSRLLLLPASHINALLGANFAVMQLLGERVLKPFLQDTLQLGPLAVTMLGMMLVKPLVIARVFVQVGPKVLLGWFGHFTMLALYTVGYHTLHPLRRFSNNYTFRRLLDALKYGSGSDYRYQAAAPASHHASSSRGSNSRDTTADSLQPASEATPSMTQRQVVTAAVEAGRPVTVAAGPPQLTGAGA